MKEVDFNDMLGKKVEIRTHDERIRGALEKFVKSGLILKNESGIHIRILYDDIEDIKEI